MEPLRQLLSFLKPYRGKILLTLFSMAGVALMTGAYALLVKNVVDDVVIKNQTGALPGLVGVILLVSAIMGICIYGQKYISSFVGQRVVLDLRGKLYDHIIKFPPSFFAKNSTSTVLSRVINDVEGIQYSLQTAATTIVREGLTILVLVGVIFYRDWKLALLSLFIFPIVALLVHYFGNRFRRLSKRRYEQLGTVTERLNESLQNQRVVQAFGRETFESRRFEEENKTLFDRLMKIAKMDALSGPAMDFLRGIGIGIIIVAGSHQIHAGALSAGTFVSFATAMGFVYMPLKRVVGLFNILNQGVGALSRIFEILNTPPAIQDVPEAQPLPPMKEEIEFEKVRFSYNRDWKLSNISFSIKAGETVALVGPSGAGKSTTIQLLLRFYDPLEGRITFDGHDIRNYTLSSLRSQISWVSQENLLFNDTIRANIAYGKWGATDREIQEAAGAARAAEFIENLPKGYDSVIGEKGYFLSGGERQRLAIARAFLRKAPILILDEATSSVDTHTEHLIQEAIRDLIQGRTTLVIAHRPSTISLANKIILLEKGRLVEVGEHRGLLESNELYKKLYRAQFLHVAG